MPKSFQANTTYCVFASVARFCIKAGGGVIEGMAGVGGIVGVAEDEGGVVATVVEVGGRVVLGDTEDEDAGLED